MLDARGDVGLEWISLSGLRRDIQRCKADSRIDAAPMFGLRRQYAGTGTPMLKNVVFVFVAMVPTLFKKPIGGAVPIELRHGGLDIDALGGLDGLRQLGVPCMPSRTYNQKRQLIHEFRMPFCVSGIIPADLCLSC